MTDLIGAADAMAEARKTPRGVEIANAIMDAFPDDNPADCAAGCAIVIGRIIASLALYARQTVPGVDAEALALRTAGGIAGDIQQQIKWELSR